MPNASRRKYQSGGGGAYQFELLGLKELNKALRGAGKEFKKSVSRQLRIIGNEVRDAIRAKAPIGTRSTARHKAGTLKRSVRTKVSRLSVRVVSDARAPDTRSFKGYRYGKRLEFDPQIGRPWFYPTWEAFKPRAVAKFNEVLADVQRAFSRGGS